MVLHFYRAETINNYLSGDEEEVMLLPPFVIGSHICREYFLGAWALNERKLASQCEHLFVCNYLIIVDPVFSLQVK